MRCRPLIAVAVLVLAAAAVPAAAASPPVAAHGAFSAIRPLAVTQATTYTFGQQPLADVLAAAGAQTKCSGLTQNELAAMMLAPTYPETGASGSSSPSPMTLSRYDTVSVNPTNANLYFQGNPSTPYSRAFWNPGVGAWQFDSAGLWHMSTAQEISTDSAAAAAASTMATGWCGASGTDAARRAAAWAPWAGCASSGVCESIYQAVFDPTTLKVSKDPAVTRGGGMVTRTCMIAGVGTVTCSRIDPSLAQGDDAFAVPGFGPTPISAPFYDYVQSGIESRVWLSSDTGYPVSISASMPLGSNARTSLTWSTSPGLCDLTTLAGSCSWTGWQPFNSVWSSRPSVVANTDGRLEMFATGYDGVVYHAWQASPNGIWSGWAQIPGLTTARSVVAARGTDGHLVVVARTTSGSTSRASYSGTAWSGWTNLGGSITSSLSAATNRDGRAEFFAITTAGSVVHQWQTSFGTWSGWVAIGGAINPTSETAVANVDGRLEVFIVAGFSTVYHSWQAAPGAPFGPWKQLGGSVSGSVSVGFDVGGRLEVFFRGLDGALWHLWQTAPNGGWSAPASLGGSLSADPIVATNRDGRLEVFAPRSGNVPWHIWQVVAAGAWSGWATFGGPAAAALAVAPQADGHLVLFEWTTGSSIYRNLQLA